MISSKAVLVLDMFNREWVYRNEPNCTPNELTIRDAALLCQYFQAVFSEIDNLGKTSICSNAIYDLVNPKVLDFIQRLDVYEQTVVRCLIDSLARKLYLIENYQTEEIQMLIAQISHPELPEPVTA